MARWFYTTVAVLGLLAVATSASAECAWVLWLEDSRWSTTNLPFHEWNLVGGHPSKDACESKIAERLISSASSMKREPAKGRTDTLEVEGNVATSKYQWIDGPSGGWSIRYLCLPDTLDPRRPKGK